MKYKIALTSVIWTNDYQNARHFDSRASQEAYFGLPALMENLPTRNLNGGNFTRLSLIVKTGEAGIGDIMSSNYAIILDVDKGKYWYYFIVNATFDSVDQMRIELEMDVIQSYYLDMTFGESMIERAHLNRWSEELVDRFMLRKGIDSAFYTRDEIVNLPKRIKRISSCTTSPYAPGTAVSEWLQNNIYAWLYAYFDIGEYTFDGETINVPLWYSRNLATGVRPPDISSPYIVICCPVMNNNNAHFYIGEKELTVDAFFDFIYANKGNLYGLKLTQFSPFTRGTRAPEITVDGNNLTITSNTNLVAKGKTKFIANVQRQYLGTQYLTRDYQLPQYDIVEQNITEYGADLQANPKIFNSDYRELKIVYAGGEYGFDIQKLYGSTIMSSDAVSFEGFEIITPEIAPTFISVIPVGVLPIYNGTKLGKIGYMQENDLSIPYSKNQLDVFLANNKNFFKQKEWGYINQRSQRAVSGFSGALSGLGGAAVSGVTGNVGGAVSQGIASILGIGINALQSEIQIEYDKQATKYTLDNMASGVDALANSNSNAFFNLAINDCKILFEELEALPNDINRALEDMHENGYVYNRMGNIKDFDTIRAKWNYVKARVEIIKTPVKIPNEVRNTIKAIFAHGIRFWRVDNWSFNQTNLENNNG